MSESLTGHFWEIVHNGGVVMWPLLGMSGVALTLIIERCWFWFTTNRPGRLGSVSTMGRLLRRGDIDGAKAMAEPDPSVYGRLVMRLLGDTGTESALIATIEDQRAKLERFMPTLSTIITVAPMLGILGTVFGIISSFHILSEQTTVSDPKEVGSGIAEALLTTAVGLIIAIAVLFPYNAFRAQIDRTLGRLESLGSASSVSQKAQ